METGKREGGTTGISSDKHAAKNPINIRILGRKSGKIFTTFICNEVDELYWYSLFTSYSLGFVKFVKKTNTPQIPGFTTNLLLH